MRRADARDQHRHQEHKGGSVDDHRPAGEDSIIQETDRGSGAQAQGIPDDLPKPELVVQREQRGGFIGHRRAVNKGRSHNNQPAQRRQLQPVGAGLMLVEDIFKH